MEVTWILNYQSHAIAVQDAPKCLLQYGANRSRESGVTRKYVSEPSHGINAGVDAYGSRCERAIDYALEGEVMDEGRCLVAVNRKQ